MSRRPATRAPLARWGILLAVAVAVAAGALAVAALRGPGEPPTLQARVHEIAADLRCPVCQNLSVADSSSQVAREMRAEIARDLRAGKSPERIREEFVAAYGDWILLEPPRRGIDLLAWLVPLGAVLGGGATVVLLVRRWASRGPEAPGPANGGLGAKERAMLRRALEEEP